MEQKKNPSKGQLVEGERAAPFLAKLSLNNWYLDTIYDKVFVRTVLFKSKTLQNFEVRVLDRFIDIFAVSQVVLAHAVSIFDRWVVDGGVNVTAYAVGLVGKWSRSIQGGKVQSYFLWVLMGVVLIVLFFLF